MWCDVMISYPLPPSSSPLLSSSKGIHAIVGNGCMNPSSCGAGAGCLVGCLRYNAMIKVTHRKRCSIAALRCSIVIKYCMLISVASMIYCNTHTSACLEGGHSWSLMSTHHIRNFHHYWCFERKTLIHQPLSNREWKYRSLATCWLIKLLIQVAS